MAVDRRKILGKTVERRTPAVNPRQAARQNKADSEQQIGPISVKDPILRIFHTSRPSNDSFRHGDYTHVSDLIHKCMRMVAISEAAAVPVPASPIWESQRLTFALGRAVQDFVTDNVIDFPMLFGRWRCTCHAPSTIGPCTRAKANKHNKSCTGCGRVGHFTKYEEILLRHEGLKVSGSTDLAILHNKRIHLAEVKSISSTGFADLNGSPQADHVVQALFYWWLAREAGHKITDRVSILYVCKEWRTGSPYLEFKVDTSNADTILAPYLAEAAAIRKYHETKEIPARRHCKSEDSSRAKTCPFVSTCFSIE